MTCEGSTDCCGAELRVGDLVSFDLCGDATGPQVLRDVRRIPSDQQGVALSDADPASRACPMDPRTGAVVLRFPGEGDAEG